MHGRFRVGLTFTGLTGLALLAAPSPGLAQEGADALPSFSELEAGWNTLSPGGRTSCAHGAPFEFFVRPGAPNRVMLYLFGGGACWDAESCDPDRAEPVYRSGPMAIQSPPVMVEALPGAGILDADHPENPFREYTLVAVPYCTGDFHMGDRDVRYRMAAAPESDAGDGASARGKAREFTIHHRGRVNAMAAVEWLLDRSDPLETVFVSGGSAGGIATPYYARILARNHPEARVVGLGDDTGSYRAPEMVVPETAAWGVPDVLDDDPVWDGLWDRGFDIRQMFVRASRDLSNLRLAQFDHAWDDFQRTVLVEEGVPHRNVPDLVRANRRAIQDEVPSFRGYLGGGVNHTVLDQPLFYLYHVQAVRLRDWVAELAAGAPVTDVDCGECLRPGFVYQESDLSAVDQAIELLSVPQAWDPSPAPGSPPCPEGAERFSLVCAVVEATRQAGELPEHGHILFFNAFMGHAVAWEVLHAILEQNAWPGPPVAALFLWDRGPDVTHEDVLEVLHRVRTRIARGLETTPAPDVELNPQRPGR